MGNTYTNIERHLIPPGEILRVVKGVSNIGDTILYMNSKKVPYITLESINDSKCGNKWGNDMNNNYIFESIGNIFD